MVARYRECVSAGERMLRILVLLVVARRVDELGMETSVSILEIMFEMAVFLRI